MAEFDPSYDSSRHLVTARLSLRPSDALKEAIEPFYKPSIADRRLSRVALRSSIGVPLEALPAQRFIYRDPEAPGRNAIQFYEEYKRRHIRPIVGRQLPQLALLNVLRNKEGALRLRFSFGLTADERQHVSVLHEFESVADTGVLDAQVDLSPADVVQNDAILHGAVTSLQSVLGVHHPAAPGLPPSRRRIGGLYSAAITSEQLSFRIGEI